MGRETIVRGEQGDVRDNKEYLVCGDQGGKGEVQVHAWAEIKYRHTFFFYCPLLCSIAPLLSAYTELSARGNAQPLLPVSNSSY